MKSRILRTECVIGRPPCVKPPILRTAANKSPLHGVAFGFWFMRALGEGIYLSKLARRVGVPERSAVVCRQISRADDKMQEIGAHQKVQPEYAG